MYPHEHFIEGMTQSKNWVKVFWEVIKSGGYDDQLKTGRSNQTGSTHRMQSGV